MYEFHGLSCRGEDVARSGCRLAESASMNDRAASGDKSPARAVAICPRTSTIASRVAGRIDAGNMPA